MKSRDQEFLERWHADKCHYERWGAMVLQRLQELVNKSVAPSQGASFIRIPPVPRLKDDESFLQKAFYRPEKNYTNPYDEIEDKIGVRLVLLLDNDVQVIGHAIESDTEIWTAVRARDHEVEKASRPFEFSYQSLHFIVRSNAEFVTADNHPIPAGIPCEVQVRTLLQHTHSEVTHDTLYKTSIQTTPEMKRAAAKSMALIEATGDYFDALGKLIAKQVEPFRRIEEALDEIYQRMVGHPAGAAGSPLNSLLLDRYGHDLDLIAMEMWLSDRRYIGQRVAEHEKTRAIFRVPAILLLYYCVEHEPLTAPINAPLPDADLEIVYSNLGKSIYG